MGKELLTTKESAEYLKVSMARIRQLIGEGRLSAERNGKSWLVSIESLEAYKAQASPGRPSVFEAKRKAETKPVRYTLMSRNYEIAQCVYDPTKLKFTQVCILDKKRVPLALCSYQAKNSLVRTFNKWWRGRGIPDSRHKLSQRLLELDLNSAFELPLKSYGLSLSDQYWLLPEDSSLVWEDINFFRNLYDMGSSEEEHWGMPTSGPWMSAVGLSSPDNTTDGMLNKRWALDQEDRRILIKGSGSSGREAYNEVIATKLYRRLLPAHRYVEYRLARWNGNDVCACETFLAENEEFIPAWYVYMLKKKPNNYSEFRHFCEVCEDLGIEFIENQMTRMLVCDSILANTDRHWGNFGVIRNIDTLEYRWAPIFDTGTSLWSHSSSADLVKGNFFYEAKPFCKNPDKQLDLLVDSSWYNPDALKGFSEEVKEYLVSVFINEKLAEAIAKGIEKRIDIVNVWARQAPTSKVDRDLLGDPETLTLIWL